MIRKSYGTIKIGYDNENPSEDDSCYEMVDITDPCYDRDTWCAMWYSPVIKGEYECFATVDNRNVVNSIEILTTDPKYKDFLKPEYFELVGGIGVDAGMAGFFNYKKTYSEEEWKEYVEYLYNTENMADPEAHIWKEKDAFFSSSGYGDGFYEVYAIFCEPGVACALKIVFINDYLEEYESLDESDVFDDDEEPSREFGQDVESEFLDIDF